MSDEVMTVTKNSVSISRGVVGECIFITFNLEMTREVRQEWKA